MYLEDINDDDREQVYKSLDPKLILNFQDSDMLPSFGLIETCKFYLFIFYFNAGLREGQTLMVQKTEVVCRRTRLQDERNMCCQNNKDRWNLENCPFFWLVYPLVGLLPAGGNKFLKLIVSNLVCPNYKFYEINCHLPS